MLSSGAVFIETDRDFNGRADVVAKAAVEEHRAKAEEVEACEAMFDSAKAVASCIARATHEANHQELFPFQDSEAARWSSDEASAERRKATHLRPTRLLIIDTLKSMKQRTTPQQGGHTIAKMMKGGMRSR